MPAYTNAKRIFKYSDEFKMKAVQWSFEALFPLRVGR